MAQRTIRDRLIDALKARGEEVVTWPTRKFIVMTRKKRPGLYWFLGPYGALRTGPKATDTIPDENHKAILLSEVPV